MIGSLPETPERADGPRRDVGRSPGPAIECRNVSFTYGNGVRANQGIDLRIDEGRIFCLLGPNGAGKTTLVRQIAAELPVTSGVVLHFGRDIGRNRAAVRRRLGVIPQSAGLFVNLRVSEHLEHMARIKGLRREGIRGAVGLAAEQAGIEALGPRRVGELSGGQQRSVLLAIALLGQPKILVLDEPTVGLDPVARRRIWEMIRAQRSRGATILLTTHYLEEAETLADWIALLERGRVRCQGTLGDLLGMVQGSVRLSRLDGPSTSPERRYYFDSFEAAQDFARAEGLQRYAVGNASLEDIYLQMVGEPGAGDPA